MGKMRKEDAVVSEVEMQFGVSARNPSNLGVDASKTKCNDYIIRFWTNWTLHAHTFRPGSIRVLLLALGF